MTEEIPIAHSISIREAGFDEYWLQDQIWANPAGLGLGDLDALNKETSTELRRTFGYPPQRPTRRFYV